jgi:hypothetical protein
LGRRVYYTCKKREQNRIGKKKEREGQLHLVTPTNVPSHALMARIPEDAKVHLCAGLPACLTLTA